MKNGIKAVCSALVLAVCAVAVAQFLDHRNRGDQGVVDLPALRVELRELVAKGRLTEAEARVRLAEAFAESKRQQKNKVRVRWTPEMQAFASELKQKVKKGELTPEEAEAKWLEATKTEKNPTRDKDTKNQNEAQATDEQDGRR